MEVDFSHMMLCYKVCRDINNEMFKSKYLITNIIIQGIFLLYLDKILMYLNIYQHHSRLELQRKGLALDLLN